MSTSKPARFPTHGPDLRALLAVCHADPDDDTARLVLADWLQEHDDPRGELVRLQCQIAALPAGDPQYDHLFERHQKWWTKYGGQWKRASCAAMCDTGPHDRGLPTIGSYDDDAYWLSTADVAYAAERPNDRVASTVAYGWPGMTWVLPVGLAEESEWDEAGEFSGDEYNEDDPVHYFDDDLSPSAEEDPFEPFRQPPWTGSPTPVGIYFPEGVTVTAELIDQAAKVPNLRGLSLYEAGVSPSLLPRIAKVKALEHLDLGSIRLTDAAVKTLAPLKRLRTLIARESSVTNAGAAALAKFAELRELRLGTRRLTAPGHQPLAKLRKLEVLQLDKANDEAIRHLAPLTRLRKLDLTGTDVTGPGLEHFPLLTDLTLDTAPIDDAGVASLAGLSRLRVLSLNGTGITGEAFAHLAGLRWLRDLSASETEIRDKDLIHLEPLKKLELLSLWGTRVTKKGATALNKKLKSASIYI